MIELCMGMNVLSYEINLFVFVYVWFNVILHCIYIYMCVCACIDVLFGQGMLQGLFNSRVLKLWVVTSR